MRTTRLKTLRSKIDSSDEDSAAPVVRVKRGLGVRHLQAVHLFCMLTFCILRIETDTEVHFMMVKINKTEINNYMMIWCGGTWPNIEIVSKLIYGFTSLIAGYLSLKLNNKCMLLGCGILVTMQFYMTPYMLKMNSWGVYLSFKLFVGITMAFVQPIVYNQMTLWFSASELIYIAPITFGGVYLGPFFVNGLGSDLAASRAGWESLYYFSANCMLFWCLCFAVFGSHDYTSSWIISRTEKTYIENNKVYNGDNNTRRHVPILSILKNIPGFAVALALATEASIVNQLYMTLLSTDLAEKELKHKSLIGLPFLFPVVLVFPIAYVGHYLIMTNKITIKTFRFVSNSIALWGCGFVLLLMPESRSFNELKAYQYVAFIFLTFTLSGCFVNIFDLSPNYSGFLAGWTFCQMTLLSLFEFLIFRHWTDRCSTGWRDIMTVFGIISILSNLFFTMAGSSSSQRYNYNYLLQRDILGDDLNV